MIEGKDLHSAIVTMDEKKLIEFAQQHKSKKCPFTFRDELATYSAEQIDDMWEHLRKMISKHAQVLFGNKEDINPNERCHASGQLMQAAIDLAQVILDESLPVSEGLLHMVVFLNGILFEIPTMLETLRNNIAQLCEKMYHLNYVNQNHFFTFNTLIYLLKRTLGPKATKKDVKRIYALRSLIPTVLKMENVDSNEIWDLFRKCASSNLYASMFEGQKIITLTLTLDTNHVLDIHQAIMKKMSSCSKKQALCYGKAYFEAWAYAFKNNDEILQNAIEIRCVQDIIMNAITKKPKPAVDSLRTILSHFHCQKKEIYVSKMLYDLYHPILWRYLKDPDGLMRAHAAQLFLDVFPLEEPDCKVVASDMELNEQFLIIKDLLLDDYPIVRTATVSRLCFTMSANWEIFPEDILKTYFMIIINELSCDSSSIEVRTAVAKGFKALLENPLTITTLQSVLPKLKHLFHDIADSVRVAFCQVLLRVKNIQNIKFYEIVPTEELFARLEVDTVTAKLIVNLLMNSFLPNDVSIENKLVRCSRMIQDNIAASRVFFRYASNFLTTQAVSRFVSDVVYTIYSYVQFCMCRKRRGEEEEDMQTLIDNCKFDDPAVITGFVDCCVVMLLGILSTLKKPENKTEFKKLMARLSPCLSALALHYKDTSVFQSIAYLASHIQPVNMPCLASLCFVRLKNMENLERSEWKTLLRCLCNQNHEGSLLNQIREWIEASLLQPPDDTPLPKKRRKSNHKAAADVGRHRLAVEMYNFLLQDKLCQRTILLNQPDSLKSFLNLVQPLEKRIELLHQKSNVLQEEESFVKELFLALLNTSALLAAENEEWVNVKFIDDVVQWTQDVLCRLTWPPIEGVAKRRNSRKYPSKAFEDIALAICREECMIIADVSCVGMLNIKTNKYIKFAMYLLTAGRGSSLLLPASKVLWKHVCFGVYMSAVQKKDVVLLSVPDCFSQIIGCISKPEFLQEIPSSDVREIQGNLSLCLTTMYHHGVLKEGAADIISCFVKNILDILINCISETWDSFQNDFEPMSSIKTSKSSNFILALMCIRPKILVFFMHQLNRHVMKSARDIKLWIACCLILLQLSDIKNVSKNLRKEVNAIRNTLNKILLELCPLDANQLSMLEKGENIGELSFNLHCHFEMRKVKDIFPKN